MQISILLCMFLKITPHVFGHPALSEIIRGSENANELGRVGEISNAAAHGRPATGLPSGSITHPVTSTAKDGTPELGSLFGGRTAQGSTSKDTSLAHNSGLVTDKHPTDIFAHKPPPSDAPPTHSDAVTGDKLPVRLNPDQIDKLERGALVEYVSNFDQEVKARRDVWRAAELEVEHAQKERNVEALLAFKGLNKKTVPQHLGQLFQEEDAARAGRIPESAKTVFQQMKNRLKTVAPLGITDEKLDKLAWSEFAQKLRVSSEDLKLATENAENALDEAVQLAHARRQSGYPAAKIESNIKKFLPKFDFQFPWKKATNPDTQSASLRRQIRNRFAQLIHPL